MILLLSLLQTSARDSTGFCSVLKMATIAEITTLLDQKLKPVQDSVSQLQTQVGNLKREKPAHLPDKKDVKWKKDGTGQQYAAWSTAWDNYDLMDQQIVSMEDGDVKTALSATALEGKNMTAFFLWVKISRILIF